MCYCFKANVRRSEKKKKKKDRNIFIPDSKFLYSYVYPDRVDCIQVSRRIVISFASRTIGFAPYKKEIVSFFSLYSDSFNLPRTWIFLFPINARTRTSLWTARGQPDQRFSPVSRARNLRNQREKGFARLLCPDADAKYLFTGNQSFDSRGRTVTDR